MRGAIRGYQKPSEATRSHQKLSKAIKGPIHSKGPIHGLSGASSVPQGGSVPMMHE